MSTYFTSDLHVGGRHKVVESRNFSNPQEHDEAILASLSHLTKRDDLWILGDVAESQAGLLSIRRALPHVRIKVVLGNHDMSARVFHSSGFNDVFGFIKWHEFWLSHCPIHPYETRGQGNLHGHVHEFSDTMPILDSRYFCVNWDFWGGPLSIEFIRQKLASPEGEMFGRPLYSKGLPR